jgi:hypothetical protein
MVLSKELAILSLQEMILLVVSTKQYFLYSKIKTYSTLSKKGNPMNQ